MSLRIQSGGLVTLDPDADEAFDVDWDEEHLPAGVGIADSTWEIEGKSGASSLDQHDDAIGAYDVNGLWAVSASGRVTRVFLTGATGIALNQRYVVTNRITTDETPPQVKDASFIVLIQQE